MVVALPSWPEVLFPQQATVLSVRVAHVWEPPAVMVVALVRPVTVTGVVAVVVVPMPMWPWLLPP